MSAKQQTGGDGVGDRFLCSAFYGVSRKYTFGMVSLIKVRISGHKQVEAKKAEAQRERIRQEETERL
ncbi:hypothetical protein PSCICN_38240 [Pseudomonas cichorii]|uniref:hypothetical protein n=1 Tax=Pseudomonas cichorii TaxID=36746 RepID=UPI001910F21F|nr:hypothetical protein [Pseudomonas cichorii]GFM83132.1 hypothetical protein PSCICN_38240 [Pseudomonas cichorii]